MNDVAPRRLPRRQQADDDRARQYQRAGGSEHAAVEPRRRQPRHAVRCHGDQHRQRPVGHDEPRGAAEPGEHQALGQHLPDDAAAPGADGRANGELARARREPSEQEVGDIAAGNQQHEAYRGEQDEQPQPVVADVKRAQTFHSGAALGIHVRLVDGQVLAYAHELVVHLREGEFRFVARIHVKIELVEHRELRGREADGNPRFGDVTDVIEVRRHDADHVVLLAVDADRAPDEAAIADGIAAARADG